MLKLCENIKQLDMLPPDSFSAKITSFAIAYGFEYNFARFYIQYVDEQVVCAVSLIDGNMTLCCFGNTDYDELKEFLNVIGYKTIQCEYSVAEKLGLKINNWSHIVKYGGEEVSCPTGFKICDDYKSVYDLLSESGFEMGNYESFLSDVCMRVNHNTATLGTIVIDGQVVACACRLFEGINSVLLGAVATKPSFRGNGIASKVVPYMAQSKKPVFLFCRNNGLVKFYEKCGFTVYGKWAYIEN